MVLRLQPGVRQALTLARASRTTSLLIVADTRLYRDGLARSLARRKGIRVVGLPIGPEDVVAQTLASLPDVVLIDSRDGLPWITALFQAVPEAKVIVLGLPETEADVIAYAEAGVSGFVARDSTVDELVACVQGVGRGDLVCAPPVAAILLERVKTLASLNGGAPRPATLTSRQEEILRLIDTGLSNKEIAQRLCIELSTVKNHVHQILDKLHVGSRREAADTLRAWDRISIGFALLGAAHVFAFIPSLEVLPL
jgi:two-component system, NarL family, nitrate/nitrite response regulator NarL